MRLSPTLPEVRLAEESVTNYGSTEIKNNLSAELFVVINSIQS
jgi:hypothetical protein